MRYFIGLPLVPFYLTSFFILTAAQFSSFTIPVGPGYGDPRFVWTYDTRVIYSPVTSVTTVTTTFFTSLSMTKPAQVLLPSSSVTLTRSILSYSTFRPFLTQFALFSVSINDTATSSYAWISLGAALLTFLWINCITVILVRISGRALHQIYT